MYFDSLNLFGIGPILCNFCGHKFWLTCSVKRKEKKNILVVINQTHLISFQTDSIFQCRMAMNVVLYGLTEC